MQKTILPFNLVEITLDQTGNKGRQFLSDLHGLNCEGYNAQEVV